MAKKYISANIAIVRMHSNIIATSLETGVNNEIGDYENQLAPERRYHRNYGNNYSDDYNAL